MVTIQIYADFIAPWCYIARRRLEEALRLLAGRCVVDVQWLSLELFPQMPREGVERRNFRAGRFGSEREADAIDAVVAACGELEQIPFAFSRIARVPNTFDAHRLVVLARRLGVQDGVVEALFRAYFTEERDLCERGTLVAAAAAGGLDAASVLRFLESDDGAEEVRGNQAKARRMAVRNVPHVTLNDWQTVGWIRDPYSLAAAIERADSPSRPTQAASPNTAAHNPPAHYGFERTRCACEFCRVYCKHIPGMLDAIDVAQMCQNEPDPLAWAEQHLQAVTDTPYPKLVPIRQANGSCHWYVNGKCSVHEQAPFACAFVDAHMPAADVEQRARAAIQGIRDDAAGDGSYLRIWRHLRDRGLVRASGNRSTLDEEVRLLRISIDHP